MIWLLVGTILPSFVVAWLLGFVIRGRAAQWGLIDRPAQRKNHAQPTPMGGGLAIWAGVLLPLLSGLVALALLSRFSQGDLQQCRQLLGDGAIADFVVPHLAGLTKQSAKLCAMLVGGTLMLLLGLLDDRYGLRWQLRLAVQFAVATGVVWQGWRLSVFIDNEIVTSIISVLWIVTLINSFNMLDNMDGLSAGVAAIAAAMLAAVTLLAPDPISQGPQLFVGGFLLVLVGSLVGFLLHNRPPARLFMGDAGSYFIGFSLALATISATFAGEGLPRHAILAPLCVLAIPIYDTLSVIAIRLRSGRSPFEADRNHFSHRLVDLGLSRSKAVLTIYLATFVCGLGALFLHRVTMLGAAAILLVVVALLAAVAILETYGRRR